MMINSVARRYASALAVLLLAALAVGLYGPFLGNPRVFDDWVFFGGHRFAYYATHPFGLDLRVPPYFSLAVVEVLFGRIEAHRIVSLAFHIACSLALYKLVLDLLQVAASRHQSGAALAAPSPQMHGIALIAAAAFAIHPVAVYGAAYLIQRTIVLATLFSLLSLILFVRGLVRTSHADALSAALMYSVAVLSKEHAVLLPAVAVLTVALANSERRFAIRHAAIYLAACAPAGLFVVAGRRFLIGEAYEPDSGLVAAQIENAFGQATSDFSWLMSAVTQAGLFFKYLALWLWPDNGAMSVDLRVDFLDNWSAGWIALKVCGFAAFGGLGLFLLLRGGRAGLAGFGMLLAWVLFLVELSTLRFQEPFVLYRSYLWGPGIMIMLAAALCAVPPRVALAAFVPVCALLLYSAHGRLVTFSHPLLLWEDAVAKLPSKPVPWGSRTLFNLGREYMQVGQPDRAVAIAERCLAEYPSAFHCVSARGLIHFQLGELDRSLPFLTRAVGLNPRSGQAHHRLGALFEASGRLEDARAQYLRALELGFGPASLEIMRLDSSAQRSSVNRAVPAPAPSAQSR